MRPLLLLILPPLAGAVATPTAYAPSFDCSRAAALDERAVCADPRLSELDEALGRANAQARANTDRAHAANLGTVAAVVHGSGRGRMGPGVRLESGDADVDRASQLQHAVEGMDGDRHLGCATLVLA
jgi:hypothetical protein